VSGPVERRTGLGRELIGGIRWSRENELATSGADSNGLCRRADADPHPTVPMLPRLPTTNGPTLGSIAGITVQPSADSSSS
jgi:hypothetical protein